VHGVGAILASTGEVAESVVLNVHLRRPDGSQIAGQVHKVHWYEREDAPGEPRQQAWFPVLEPGRYTLLVAWNGAAPTSIPVDVKALETARATLSSP
jgi:hypothetical protein